MADRTPAGEKSQNMGLLGHFGLGSALALREIPGPGRNRKNANSRCKGSRNGKKKYYAIRDGCPQIFYATCLRSMFWPTGPPGAGNREIRGFSAILAQDGLWQKSQVRAENRKTQFPGARGPEIEKKVTTLSAGWVSATFLPFTFCLTGPPGVGNRKTRVF